MRQETSRLLDKIKDNVKNTFFIDNEDCETTIDNEPNENIKDNNTLEDDYSKRADL